MQLRQIGTSQTETMKVSAIGLGEMPLSQENPPDEADAHRVVHAALDAGVTLIDTADAYAPSAAEFGHGERLVAAALKSYDGDTGDVLVATKGGHTRTPDNGWGLDGSPEYLKRACETSLRNLGVESIGLYQYHRPDPDVPWAESIGALRDLLDAGKIRFAGVSNASIAQIEEANRILGGRLAGVQNQFSPEFRSSLDELRYCGDHGIAFLPWSPLGGISSAADLGSNHASFAEIARSRQVSPQQITLAWMLAQGPHVLPIPGSSRPDTIRASARAAGIDLTADEISRLDSA
jgi:aryl-alcohol dehydrogenase-like predicted oxidoreductase